MRLLKKYAFKLLPSYITGNIIRENLNLSMAYDENDITIKIATTQIELECAYKLLHDIYVESGLMDKQIENLRVNIFSTLPHTSVVIAKKGEIVVGTVSLIKDSSLGLPSDNGYSKENDYYRNLGYKLVEVSALAIDSKYRRKESGNLISIQLMNYLRKYTEEYNDCSMLIATVHPRAFPFYRGLFNFKKNGKVVKYRFVKNALAIHICADLKESKKWIKNKTSNLMLNKNLYQLFYQTDLSFMIYPKRDGIVINDIVMTPDLLKYFFITKTNLFSNLSIEQLALIKSAYSAYFDLNRISMFRFIKNTHRPYRFSSNTILKLENRNELGRIRDISITGLYLETKSNLALDEVVVLNIKLSTESVLIKGKVVRENLVNNKRYPAGYGIEFFQTQEEVLTQGHMTKLAKSA